MAAKLHKQKMPKITYNQELEKYDGVVLFPKKVEEANKTLKRVGLPKLKRKKR